MSTVLIRNVNPLGYVDLPVLGRCGDVPPPDTEPDGTGCLHPGEVFECPAEIAGRAPDPDDVDDLGEGLLAQVGNYELAGPDPFAGLKTIEDMKAYAADHNIDLKGATKKAEILKAIRSA